MNRPDLPYAEVIGDPIDHSLSPTIHNHWLERLGIAGAYRRQLLAPGELEAYLRSRRRDPFWRGCNVTMPLKQEAAALVAGGDAQRIGAANLIARAGAALVGLNTDVDGVRAALDGSDLEGERAVVIGAGGSARAATVALASRGASITILARDPARAQPLSRLADHVTVRPLHEAGEAVARAAAIVNATPLGTNGGPPMPPSILCALGSAARGAIAVELVYWPLETPFLAAAAAAGLRAADGLTVLVGQARPAFICFFGVSPPPDDAELRALLVRELRAG